MKHFSNSPRKFLIVSLFLFLISPQYFTYAQIPTTIIITEIGVRETAENEWVEIFNPTSSAIDISGWKFFEDGVNHGLTVFRGNSTLAAGEYAIIANKADVFAQKYLDYTGTILDSSWGTLKEDGEEIGLKDSANTAVELFTYPAISGYSISLERIDVNTPGSEITNWAPHPDSHSLGKQNEISLPTQDNENQQVPIEEIPEVTATEVPAADLPPEEIADQPLQESPPPDPVVPVAPEQSPPPTSVFITAPTKNSPPKAIIQIQSGNLIATNSTTVNFDGRASFDPDGEKLIYSWDMGDGKKETTANPAPHKYGTPGNYTIALTVTDPTGLKDTATIQVNVLKGTTTQKESSVASSVNTTPPVQSPIKEVTVDVEPPILEKPNNIGTVDLNNIYNGNTQEVVEEKSTKKGNQNNGELSNQIIITEVYPKPTKDDKMEEWIELYNAGSDSINLGNWTVQDASKKKPFSFPDTLGIAANEYLLLPKSLTKIALNDNKESLFLKDFNGTVIDSISYEGARAGKSYALLGVKSNGVLTKESWQWTADISPGKENPMLSLIVGVVEKGNDKTISVRGADNSLTDIELNPDELDPLFASLLMGEGSSVALLASDNEAGQFTLNTIGEVRPANKKPKDDSSGASTWLLLTGMSGVSLLNAPRAWEIIKPLLERMKM